MTGIPLPFCLTLNQSTADDDTERKTNISFYPFNVCIFPFCLPSSQSFAQLNSNTFLYCKNWITP